MVDEIFAYNLYRHWLRSKRAFNSIIRLAEVASEAQRLTARRDDVGFLRGSMNRGNAQ